MTIIEKSTSGSEEETASHRQEKDDQSTPPLANASSSVSSGERKDTITHHNLPPRPATPSSRPTSPLSCSSSSVLSGAPPPPPRESLVRILSNASVGSESPSPTCSICLDPMTVIDHRHPLLCPTRHCHFNLCAACISSLLSSSKDDYEVASDGNAHVKIFLNCPNCRSDLSGTIRDVLLLRKVDTVVWLTSLKNPPKLTPSQERTKKAMQELDVQEAIQKAREAEEKFWAEYKQEHYQEETDDDDNNDDTDDKEWLQQLSRYEISINHKNPLELSPSDEEWGVEADLDNGVHNSFRVPFDQMLDWQQDDGGGDANEHIQKAIDTTLFSGLDFCMTHAEKLQVTQWMTSGEVSNLVHAAVLLRQLEQYARQGKTTAKRQASINRRASVFEIVDETRKVHNQQQKEMSNCELLPTNPNAYLTSTRNNPTRQRQLAAERRQLDQSLQEQSLLLERFPLPVRMPKCVELELRDPTSRFFPLRFANDVWDGTVLDAYSKITISGRAPKWTVTKKKTQHAGVFHVLSLGKYRQHYGCIEMTLDQPPRVLVASVKGEGGRQGIIKGDVVTHIDGQEFHGTVDDLINLLQTKVVNNNEQQGSVGGKNTFQMILNAEPSIAEALKRRSMVLK